MAFVLFNAIKVPSANAANAACPCPRAGFQFFVHGDTAYVYGGVCSQKAAQKAAPAAAAAAPKAPAKASDLRVCALLRVRCFG